MRFFVGLFVFGLFLIGGLNGDCCGGCGGCEGSSYPWWNWNSWWGSSGCGGMYPCGADSYSGGDLGPMYPQPVSNCPKIDCKTFSEQLIECESTQDCLRSESCCENHCVKKKQCMKRTTTQYDWENMDQVQSCPVVKSCWTLINDYKDPKECDDDNECLRKQKCCSHPCDDNAVSDFPEKICMNAANRFSTL